MKTKQVQMATQIENFAMVPCNSFFRPTTIHAETSNVSATVKHGHRTSAPITSVGVRRFGVGY
jgi:hypothetical protein